MAADNVLPRFRIGLLVNPVAGAGGPPGLKGSDGTDIQAAARSRGSGGRGVARARRTLSALLPLAERLQWYTWGGDMGATALTDWPEAPVICGMPGSPSTPADTRQAAAALAAAGVELVLFAGGDGTARDVCDGLGRRVPVLGIPAGVKMQSGVFATTPESAAEIVQRLLAGALVRVVAAEVRDIDEAALRDGVIRSRFYGEMQIPEVGGYLAQTKIGGRESETLALEEIVAHVLDHLTGPALLGPGSTTGAIKRALGFDGTLLGFDYWPADGDARLDLDRAAIDALDAGVVTLIVSFSRAQGFLFGRGNQQLSPEFLARLPRRQLWVVATRTKLLSLAGAPLRVDTDDAELDRAFSGLLPVITGYDDQLWYRVLPYG